MNRLITLEKIGDPSIGYLSYFEANKEIPFEIKRIYFTYAVPVDSKRGMHSHKKLQQLLWCPYGVIEVILDNGKKREVFLLDSPNNALLVGNGIWREMNWKTEGSILCVAASDYYSEDDYIRDYYDFLNYVKEGHKRDENKL
jgi:hypothetical protein